MTPELTYLVCTLVLALAQILLTAALRTRETGLPYNAGPRDTPSPVPVGKITARVMRAQANLFETLPIFIGALLATQFAQVHTPMTHCGAAIYFWARLVYVPLYAFGIPYIRSAAWVAALIGIFMLLDSMI